MLIVDRPLSNALMVSEADAVSDVEGSDGADGSVGVGAVGAAVVVVVEELLELLVHQKPLAPVQEALS